MHLFRVLLCLNVIGYGQFKQDSLGLILCHWNNHVIAHGPGDTDQL